MKTLTLTIFTLLLLTVCSEASSKEDYFTNNNSKDAFSQPISHMSYEEEDSFILGKSFFTIPWVEAPSATTARDGIGPLFSANTCKTCHPNNGAGLALDKNGEMSRSLLLRLSQRTSEHQELLTKNGFEPDSTYGAQLSRNGNHNVPFEGIPTVTYEEINGTYLDGVKFSLRKPSYGIKNLNYGALDKETVIAPRIGSALIGLGLLARISDKDLLAYEDVNDSNHDGISGKANYAYSPETNSTVMGRFTWKASATSVKHQSAGAAHNDMGLSNPLFPLHNCSSKQEACLKEAKKGNHQFDLPAKRLDAIAFYLSNLAIPKPREIGKHKKGKKLFSSLNCIKCHVSNHTTSDGIKIQPYSDLLLHDMGDSLADGRSEFLATGTEWRTAPLWGMGLYKKVSGEANFLHDGRARSVEEAILWHGGEAQKSKEAFMQLSVKQRERLLLFLETI
jgi:CxxC motif-containing protein (DUF1111 family)